MSDVVLRETLLLVVLEVGDPAFVILGLVCSHLETLVGTHPWTHLFCTLLSNTEPGSYYNFSAERETETCVLYVYLCFWGMSWDPVWNNGWTYPVTTSRGHTFYVECLTRSFTLFKNAVGWIGRLLHWRSFFKGLLHFGLEICMI